MMENMALILYYVLGLFKEVGWVVRIVLELVFLSGDYDCSMLAMRDVMDVNEGLVLTLGLFAFELFRPRHLPQPNSSVTSRGGFGPMTFSPWPP